MEGLESIDWATYGDCVSYSITGSILCLPRPYGRIDINIDIDLTQGDEVGEMTNKSTTA